MSEIERIQCDRCKVVADKVFMDRDSYSRIAPKGWDNIRLKNKYKDICPKCMKEYEILLEEFLK